MSHKFDRWSLLQRTVVYYGNRLFWLVLTCALTLMVLSGSLFIGDSVKGTLYRLAQNRRGQVKVAVFNELNWFRADRAKVINEKTKAKAAAIISLKAQAENPEVSSIAISLYGVDGNFFKLGPLPTKKKEIEPGKIYLNESAAKELACKVGDSLNVSFFKPTFLPLDAPLTRVREGRVATRFTVGGILAAEEFGDFDYGTTQTIGSNAFVALDYLAEKLERKSKANCLLFANDTNVLGKISQSFELFDFGLQLQQGKTVQLTSMGIFISPQVVEAAKKAVSVRQEIYTYFVNEIRAGQKSAPYSFVAGMTGGPVPENMPADGIVINDWLARKLDCEPGVDLQLRAFRLNPLGHLYEESATFKVHSIVKMEGAAKDESLMPPFPGMKDANSCDEWEPGIPIDLDKVEKDDEKYWEDFKGTPKAFCTLARAQKLWSTRFGSLTAIRFPQSTMKEVREGLKKELPISRLGFKIRNIANESTVGVNKAVDFSGLFIGLSFFVIVAALILCNLLLGFYLDERESEIGLYRVLRFSKSWLLTQLLSEGVLCLFLAALPGIFLGMAYAHIVLKLLGTLWQGAVNTQQINLIINVPTIFVALILTFTITVLTFFFKLKSFSREVLSSQLKGLRKVERPSIDYYCKSGLAFLVLSFLLLILVPARGEVAKIAAFFVGGFLLLVASTQLCIWALLYFSKKSTSFTMKTLALRNCIRRLDRSKAVIRLMACAIFLILAVTVNRKGMLKDPFVKTAGTGGFSFFVETTLPMTGDLNSEFGRKELRLRKLGKDVRVLALPSSSGNEASCLNLNRVVRPRLLGVAAEAFAGRFTFKGNMQGVAKGWKCLSHEFADPNVIPVVADSDVIMWSLGKGLGQDLAYENSLGQSFKLRFVGGLSGSIFQGNVLVSLENFYKLCPESSGFRTLLIDAPKAEFEETKKTLVRALSRLGGQVQTCAYRLAKFNGVQNTYLSIFLALGGLAMILGCAGLAILLRRNVLEREDEFFILRSMHYKEEQLRFIVFYEHCLLFLGATECGLISAAIALVPAISSATGLIPWKEMFAFVGIIVVTGLIALKLSLSLSFAKKSDF